MPVAYHACGPDLVVIGGNGLGFVEASSCACATRVGWLDHRPRSVTGESHPIPQGSAPLLLRDRPPGGDHVPLGPPSRQSSSPSSNREAQPGGLPRGNRLLPRRARPRSRPRHAGCPRHRRGRRPRRTLRGPEQRDRSDPAPRQASCAGSRKVGASGRRRTSELKEERDALEIDAARQGQS